MDAGSRNILTQSIKQQAQVLGFEAFGIAAARPLEQYRHKYTCWLAKGYNATMGYMERNLEKRLDAALLVEGAASVIVMAHNYFPEQLQDPDAHYKVSKYAYGKDYHTVIKKKLFSLLDFIREQTGGQVQARVFTDSAPVLERAWAVKAGLGWTGKNSCLIIPEKGSFFFLSEIIINLPLNYDTPFEKDLCGNCSRCLQACPTGAITSPGIIDASKCISYLTIERKEDIPSEFEGKCSNWIFGCDICQDVCPYNRFSQPHNEPELHPLDYVRWQGEQWESLTMETYTDTIKKPGSPLSRAGFEKLKRNILFAKKNNP